MRSTFSLRLYACSGGFFCARRVASLFINGTMDICQYAVVKNNLSGVMGVVYSDAQCCDMRLRLTRSRETCVSFFLETREYRDRWHSLCLVSCNRLMPPPHRAEALSDAFVWCLSDVWRLSVCLSRTSGLTREQRGLGRLKLSQR